jgi:hypothetical protein
MMETGRNNDGVDQQLLDLLIDGELSDEQERDVIARLEESPDGWRRCALAFLENRCWQRVAQAVTQPCSGDLQAAVIRPAGATRRTQPWAWALLMAAIFLVAFGIGTFLRPIGHNASRPEIARPGAPALPASPTLAQDNNARRPPGDQGVESAGDLYLGNLKLVNDAGSEIDVPVYDWDQHMVEELMYHSQPLPPELVPRLKRHQVRSSQSYVPVQLQDGRTVVVPVQEVDITRVGGTAY